MYKAYVSRATGGEFDNEPLIVRILDLRRELADLLGYQDFADYRLEENMVKTGAAALAFVQGLAERTEPYWQEEVEALTTFAQGELGLEGLEPWDVPYTTEKLRKAKFNLDEEELRPYFPPQPGALGAFQHRPPAFRRHRQRARHQRIVASRGDFLRLTRRGRHPPGLVLRRLVPARVEARRRLDEPLHHGRPA